MGVSGLRIERVGAQVASGSSIGWMGAGGEAGETTEDGSLRNKDFENVKRQCPAELGAFRSVD